MDDYLSKPVKSEALCLKLAQWINPSRAEKRLNDNEPAQYTGGKVVNQVQRANQRESRQSEHADLFSDVGDLSVHERESPLNVLQTTDLRNDLNEIRQTGYLLKSSNATASRSLPVDVECLTDAASENPEKLKRIVELYVRHTAERLEELKRAIKQESASDVCAIAHKCLGSSRTCGMIAIVPSLTELERIGQGGDLHGAEDQLKTAQAAFEKTKRFLGEYVEQLAA
jgi:HPt (histidine-containing phosphotransfer) domain-containing protein